MWKILAGMPWHEVEELRRAGLVYWRALPTHPDWKICPRLRAEKLITHADITPEQVAYAVETLYSRVEHAIFLEE